MAESVKLLDITKIRPEDFKAQFVGCLVLTNDRKILLQQRGHDFVTHPDYLCEFGGHIEKGEKPLQALLRELNEELGALAQENEIVSLGALTEAMSGYTELIYVYFWNDVRGTITGCYEGTARYFENVEPILEYPKITDGLRWMLRECQQRGLLTK